MQGSQSTFRSITVINGYKLLELRFSGYNTSTAALFVSILRSLCHLCRLVIRGDGRQDLTYFNVCLATMIDSLTSLTLIDCGGSPDVSIFHNKKLKALKLEHCGFAGATIAEICQGCPELTRLNVSRSYNITSDEIAALLLVCTKLDRPELVDCTIKGSIFASVKASSLSYLNIAGTTIKQRDYKRITRSTLCEVGGYGVEKSWLSRYYESQEVAKDNKG